MSETVKLRNRLGGVGDYLFGRNATIGIASLMLLTISGYATWNGMNDFIVGVSAVTVSADREIPGGLSVSNELLVIAIVAALTFLMWLALRESFRARQMLTTRAITFPLYLFLALWSVGFGYGFWWSLIAGEEATRLSMTNLEEDARSAGSTITTRLQAVRAQLDNVVTWSNSQMVREEASGGSCGISSRPGRGPLYNARAGVRDSVASLREGIAKGWIEPVQADVAKLQTTTLLGKSFAERKRNFDSRAREIRAAAQTIAARSNAFGQSTAAEMRALADAVDIPPRRKGFSCYDPTLGQRLRKAADQAQEPVQIVLREAVFNEGPAGVAHAVKTLWSNVGAYTAGVVGYILSMGQTPGVLTKGGHRIGGRDLIALLVTIGIDLGLFVLMALNPPLVPANRATGLAAPVSKLRLPSGAVVRQLASAISTAVARAPGVNLEWVRRHFIHHRGASYFVIPNLYSCSKDHEEELKALAMNQLAGVFENVDLVRALTEDEAQRFGEEEERGSTTDLARYRGEYQDEKKEGEQPLRNHGLLSKAQRALGIAGWSEQAQRDVEVYRLVDVEGLTPLLTLLSEASIGHSQRSSASEVTPNDTPSSQLDVALQEPIGSSEVSPRTDSGDESPS